MKIARCLFIAGLGLAFAVGLGAQNAKEKEKTPADLAAEAFFKLRDDKDTPIDSARAAKVVGEGMKFLAENPRHGRVTGVVNSLATYGTRMRDKKLAAVHDYWLTQLKFEIVNRRTARDVTDDQQAVWGLLEVAVAAYQARQEGSRDAVRALREKVDLLAAMPKGGRFLLNAERDFLAVLVEMRAFSAAEAQARKLLEHKDAKIVALAQDELKLIALRQNPVELKFTALDGKPFDLASTRGKVVVVLFWSRKTDKFETDIEPVRDALAAHKNVEVVAVCLDPQADRAAVEKFLKAKKLKWTVLHDEAASAEVASQFAVKAAPAAFVLNRSGTVAAANVRLNRIDAEVKRLAPGK
jgi:peroxiredoxin